jgi:hypothetical protein
LQITVEAELLTGCFHKFIGHWQCWLADAIDRGCSRQSSAWSSKVEDAAEGKLSTILEEGTWTCSIDCAVGVAVRYVGGGYPYRNGAE